MDDSIGKTVHSAEFKNHIETRNRMEQEGNESCGESSLEVRKRRSLRAKQERQVNREQLVKLIEEQEYRCKLSGIELTPNTASLDHVIPVSKGGEHAVGNVAWVHSEINRMKGQLSVEEFVALCSKVVQYNR